MQPPAPPPLRVHFAGNAVHGLTEAIERSSRALGRGLASAGFALQIGAFTRVDELVFRAFLEACDELGVDPRERLRVLTDRGARPTFESRGAEVVPYEGGLKGYLAQLGEADAVVLLGGGVNVPVVYNEAIARGKPVFPLPITGGAAELLFDELVAGLRSGRGDLRAIYGAVSAGDLEALRRDSPDAWVEALLSFRRRNGERRPAPPVQQQHVGPPFVEAVEAPRVEEGPLVADYANDGIDLARGDHLSLGPDVDAFATLICSTVLKPPLSIGLFGEWGSGKTYFMRKLQARIRELSRGGAPEGAAAGGTIAVHENVVQIEFNAWQYMEGNLWASLVEHIFRKLRPDPEATDEAKADEIRRKLLTELLVDEAQAREAQRAIVEAQRAVDDAKRELAVAEEQRAAAIARQADLTPRSELYREAVRLLELTGWKGGRRNPTAETVSRALGEVRSLAGRGASMAVSLRTDLRSPAGWWKIAFVALVVLSPLVAIGLRKLYDDRYAGGHEGTLVAALGSAATFLGGAVGAARSHLRSVHEWLSRVESTRTAIDEKIAAAEAVVRTSRDAQVAAIAAGYAKAKQDYEEAQRQKEEIAARAARTRDAIARLTPARMLSDFLQDRLASEDYRRHLGVMAKIRDDFERLSNYVCPEEPRAESIGIDRIVLYIDDLDRCPPGKVVQVLEAVHLLLAFRLFVVVVGVDARWIAHALKSHYSAVLSDGDAPRPDGVFGEAATPHDYLEKIFQVPFWLAPMGEGGCKEMLESLLGDDRPPPAERVAAEEQAPMGPRTVAPQMAAGAGLEVFEAEASAGQDDAPIPVAPEVPVGIEARKDEGRARVARRLKRMEIRDEERAFMGALAPLLHRSPRALKRFVNVYRLIKVSLRPDELGAGLGAPPRHEIVLFLLAVTVGMPVVSQAFFDAIARATDDVPDAEPPPSDLAELLARMEKDATAPARRHAELAYQADILRLVRWRASRPEGAPFNPSLADLGRWSRRVARFSYRVNPW